VMRICLIRVSPMFAALSPRLSAQVSAWSTQISLRRRHLWGLAVVRRGRPNSAGFPIARGASNPVPLVVL
jgi:hypothetical protein